MNLLELPEALINLILTHLPPTYKTISLEQVHKFFWGYEAIFKLRYELWTWNTWIKESRQEYICGDTNNNIEGGPNEWNPFDYIEGPYLKGSFVNEFEKYCVAAACGFIPREMDIDNSPNKLSMGCTRNLDRSHFIIFCISAMAKTRENLRKQILSKFHIHTGNYGNIITMLESKYEIGKELNHIEREFVEYIIPNKWKPRIKEQHTFSSKCIDLILEPVTIKPFCDVLMLDVSGNTDFRFVLPLLGTALADNAFPNLKHLNLSAIGIRSLELFLLEMGERTIPTLRSLDLSRNIFHDKYVLKEAENYFYHIPLYFINLKVLNMKRNLLTKRGKRNILEEWHGDSKILF